MLRYYVEKKLFALSYTTQSRYTASLPPGWAASSIDEAKRWIAKYKSQKAIKKDDAEVTFTRSSGPGGQSTATLMRIVLSIFDNSTSIRQTHGQCLEEIGTYNFDMTTVYISQTVQSAYIRSSDSIQTSAMTSRSQGSNLDECLSKLHSLILKAALDSVPTLPSEAQQERVKEFQRKEQSERKEHKMKRRDVKRGRSAKWDD
ncbi:hypothetical protein FRC17_005088 [Serendipita sp. 399]|nr:hypothetical protein FRC17_005088 [Serendipita sp. 399]